MNPLRPLPRPYRSTWLRTVFAVAALTAVVAGPTPPADAAPGLVILSPPGDEVVCPTAQIGVEVAAAGLESVSVLVAGARVEAHRRGDRFVALGVSLRAGSNLVRVVAAATDGGSLSASRRVTLQDPRASLQIDCVPRCVEGTSAKPRVVVSTSIDAADCVELLVDADGDGAIDRVLPFAASFEHEFTAQGRYRPQLAVRTRKNLLLCCDASPDRRFRIAPPSVTVPDSGFDGVGRTVHDVELDPRSRRTYVLCGDDKQVRVFLPDGKLVQEIALTGTEDPRGIGLDGVGNLYVADATAHRIVRYIAASDYAPDPELPLAGGFGIEGTEAGSLQGPTDVAVENDTVDRRIFVADTGNHRVQVFTAVGGFDREFDGADSPDGQLSSPQSLILDQDGDVVVSDRGHSKVRVFNTAGRQLRAYDCGVLGNTATTRLGKLSLDTESRSYLIADPGSLRVLRLDAGGGTERVFDLPSPGAEVAVLDRTSTFERLLLAVPGAARLTALRLIADAPDADPVAMTLAFLRAHAAGDIEQVDELLARQRRARYRTDLSTPARRQLLDALAAAAGALRLDRVVGRGAVVIGDPVDDHVLRVELIRDADTDAWRVLNY